ncbi:MAG: segregation and condensation protein A [Acidimicrobiales bacterium]
MPYTVSTPVFEGPFDLLLHLITREQVDLWEVSLSSIVDAYVSTLEEMRAALDLEAATEFLLIAAILLELKTRRLLPGRDDVDLEEELALWEERDLLLARLLEAKTFKDAAATMARRMDAAGLSYPRVAGLEDRFVDLAPDLLAGITPAHLHAAMGRLLEPKPVPRVRLDHVAPIRVSVAEVAVGVLEELRRVGTTTFSALTVGKSERLEVIVCFLALLELFKQGAVDLAQEGSFSTLQVSLLAEDTSTIAELEEYQG